jgi:hypothetical protein
MRRWSYLICGVLALGPIATVAAGDSPQPYPQCAGKPTEADQKAAKSLFTAGQVSFNEADYKTAIQYWRDSHKRDCTAHLLLLNLARAFELNGDKREAVLALRTYLERQPNAADGPQIQRRIDNLEAQLGAAAQVGTGDPTGPTAVPGGDGGVQPSPTGTVSPAPTETGEPPAGPTGARPYSFYPWIAVGAGGVLAVIGGVVYGAGSGKVSDAEKTCPDRKCPATAEGQAAQDTGDTGRSQMTTGGVMLGVGAAALVGGLVWQFAFNNPKPLSDAPAVTGLGPSFGQGFSGLSLQGRF